MTAVEARYLHARLAAHRAWTASQPQYVIPGLLDELDGTQTSRELTALRSIEPALPLRHLTAASPGAGSHTSTGPGRMSSTDRRGRGR